jgi:translation elongation factor EF-Tu-like GTPase
MRLGVIGHIDFGKTALQSEIENAIVVDENPPMIYINTYADASSFGEFKDGRELRRDRRKQERKK